MDISVLSFEELKVFAKSLEGIGNIAANIGEDTLRNKVKVFLENNPDAMPKTPEDEVNPSEGEADDASSNESETKVSDNNTSAEDEASKTPEGLVKIKSDSVRGVVGSSVGEVEFDRSGFAEVTSEQAEHFTKLKGFTKC